MVLHRWDGIVSGWVALQYRALYKNEDGATNIINKTAKFFIKAIDSLIDFIEKFGLCRHIKQFMFSSV